MTTSWEEISESLRIEEVLEDLGIGWHKPNRKGWANSRCPLPTHPGADRNPSFGVNYDELAFNCWVCGGGNIATLVSQMQQVSYEEALEYLEEFADVDIDRDEVFENMIDRNLGKDKPPLLTRERSHEMPYLHPKALEEFPYPTTRQLAKWDVSIDCARAFGLKFDKARPRGDYRGPALIIPHYFENSLVGWQERWLDDDRPDWIPKYTNTDDFPKEWTLYNFDRAKSLGKKVVVVESVTSVWRLHMLQIPAAATFGASLGERQLDLLKHFDEITLWFDLDDAGDNATANAIVALDGNAAVYVALYDGDLANKSDPADLSDDQILRSMDRRIVDLEWTGADYAKAKKVSDMEWHGI